jgi:hypothetical protein
MGWEGVDWIHLAPHWNQWRGGNCNDASGSTKSCGFLAWLNNRSVFKGSPP